MKFYDYLNEIISKEEWKSNYRNIFIKNFDQSKYLQIVKQLTTLFKKLNKGKLKKTLVFDFGSKKLMTLNKIDENLIEVLVDMGYEVNPEMYMTGIVKKKGKEKSIFDILDSFASKNKEKMKNNYEKTRKEEIKDQINFIDNLEIMKILKNGKIDKSKLNIFQNTGKKIVLTYDHRSIASQSTGVGWTSCMNLNDGCYSECVASGVSDGVFIAYLVKAGDEYTLEHPSARILLKPYEGKSTGKLYWKADKIYGMASDDFKIQVQKIVDKVQGVIPKESDIYDLTDNTYNDTLDKQIISYSNKEEKEIHDKPMMIKYIDNPSEKLQLIAVNSSASMIQYIKNPTKKVQIESVKKNPLVIHKIENPCEEAQLESISIDGLLLRFIKNPTEKVQTEALKSNGLALQHIKNPSEKLQLIALKHNERSIKFINNPSEKIQLFAVKQNTFAVKYIKDPTEKVQLIVVKEDGSDIDLINNPSEKVQLEAVKNDGHSIVYISNPSEKIKFEAVNQNVNAIEHISNPSEKLQLMVVNHNPNFIDKIKNPTELVQLTSVKKNKKSIKYINNPTEKVLDYVKNN